MRNHDKITTAEDPAPARHKAMLMVLVWLAVYPTVTVMSALTAPFGLPLWVETFVSTILTVPTITYLVVPNAKRVIARFDPKA